MLFRSLTPENVVPFLDEYLRQLVEVNKDTAIDLLLYLDFALSIKDNELLSFMLWRIVYVLDTSSRLFMV